MTFCVRSSSSGAAHHTALGPRPIRVSASSACPLKSDFFIENGGKKFNFSYAVIRHCPGRNQVWTTDTFLRGHYIGRSTVWTPDLFLRGHYPDQTPDSYLCSNYIGRTAVHGLAHFSCVM